MGICVYQYLRFARESNELLWEGEVIKVIFKGLVDCDISLFMGKIKKDSDMFTFTFENFIEILQFWS